MYYIFTGEKERVSIEELSNDIANLVKSSILNSCYPIGSIYMSVESTSPSILFGGTWGALNEGRVLIGANSTYPVNSKGGEVTHTLTVNEIPSHTHETTLDARHGRRGAASYAPTWSSGDTRDARDVTVESGSIGGSQAHNNMQPYLAVYMWKRIS